MKTTTEIEACGSCHCCLFYGPGTALCGSGRSYSVHWFESSGRAYDACQCSDAIKDGDVLVVESERVVGIAHTWPVAVTVANGELHRLAAETTAESWANGNAALRHGFADARKVARRLGYGLLTDRNAKKYEI